VQGLGDRVGLNTVLSNLYGDLNDSESLKREELVPETSGRK
jgi:hypothetical protein